MSRTIRKNHEWVKDHCYFRNPHTFSEIRQLDGILHEGDLTEYSISKMNRIRSREHSLPTVYDDIVISAYYELDHN